MNKNSLTRACLLALSLMMGSGAAYAKTPPDQLIIGMNMNNLLTLDPAAMTGNEVVGIVVNLYDSLVELDPNELTHVRPALAKSWDIAPDRKTLTFHLRDDVKFHSGNPLTAQDVVWSMRRLLHLNLAQAVGVEILWFQQEKYRPAGQRAGRLYGPDRVAESQ